MVNILKGTSSKQKTTKSLPFRHKKICLCLKPEDVKSENWQKMRRLEKKLGFYTETLVIAYRKS